MVAPLTRESDWLSVTSGGELDPFGGPTDGVAPVQGLDTPVNSTSPEVLTQPTLVVEVVDEASHKRTHLDGLPIQRAAPPAGTIPSASYRTI